MNAARSTRRGAGLVEVIVVSGLFVVLLFGLVTVGVNAASQYATDSSKMMADSDASMALQSIARDVRNGIRATVSSDGRSITVVMPVVNTQGDYDRYAEGSLARYFLNTTTKRLCKQVGTNTPTTLGDNITDVQFTASGSEIGISLTARMRNGGKTKQTVLSTNVALRNEPEP